MVNLEVYGSLNRETWRTNIFVIIFCMWITTQTLYEYQIKGEQYLIVTDMRTMKMTLKPKFGADTNIDYLPEIVKQRIIDKSIEIGYNTCARYCAGGKPDLPKGTPYSNCWTFDENGEEQRILEYA